MILALYELDLRNRQFAVDLNLNTMLQELSLPELI